MAIKMIFMIVFGLSCFAVGNSVGDGAIKDQVQLIISVVVSFGTLLGAFGYEKGSEERDEKKRRQREADRIFWKSVQKQLSENTILNLESHCAQAAIPCCYVDEVSLFFDTFGASRLQRFYSFKTQRAYRNFMRSLSRYLKFTATHLFATGTGGYTLRQMTSNGIENDRALFDDLNKRYEGLLDDLVRKYYKFANQAEK